MISVGSPAGTGEVPGSTLPLEQASEVRDGAVHGEALVETKREGRRHLAGRRMLRNDGIWPDHLPLRWPQFLT